MRVALLALLAWCAPTCAQTVVTSPGPDSVSVTVYRDPQRSADTAIDRQALAGFALITETRELELPPGVVTLRFEGVAGGIDPATAIVFGAPVQEKNRDRQLLSQRGLLDAFTGQAVTVRRTDAATGKVVEETGTVRSGPGGVILATRAGFEALHCTGLNQTLLYPEVPANLTAKPTLSVTTRDQPGGRRTLTLSYIARNFDWQANYVGELSEDASRVELLGWLTLASADPTSFADARLYAVAGRLAKVEDGDDEDGALQIDDSDAVAFECWPAGNTSSGAAHRPPNVAAPGEPAPIAMRMVAASDSERLEMVIVTGARVAAREDLGDLKLYRVPFPVTVAAHSQKQIAFLSKPAVQGELVYRSRYSPESPGEDGVQLLYRIRNVAKAGLGEALPSGQVALFQSSGGRRALVGQATLADKAVGEDVEWELGQASNVSVEIGDDGAAGDHWTGAKLTVTNANPWAIVYEAEFQGDDDARLERFSARMAERRGMKVWRVTVPANGRRTLDFRVVEPPA